MRDGVHEQAGWNTTLGDPHKGFRPAKAQWLFDDLERDSFLSAKTRLGEASARIALLESELYARVRQCAECNKDGLYVPVTDKALGPAKYYSRAYLFEKKHCRVTRMTNRCLEGRKLLDMVKIYPMEGGCYTAPDGKQIIFDPELGVLWKDGEK